MVTALEFAGLSLIKQYLKTEQDTADTLDAKSTDLVEAMPLLLQLISRQAEALQLAQHELGLEADAIWDVAVRLLKNIYLSDSNDEYRVLGLNPWCGISEARERHRYLIRLFHPDRGMLSSLDGEPDFAAIINSAYTNIHSDLSKVDQHVAAGLNGDQQRLSRQFRYKFKHGGKIHLAAFAAALGIYKLTPRGVWLALIIISLAFIAHKYWNNRYPIFLAEPGFFTELDKSAATTGNATQKVSLVTNKSVPVKIISKPPEIVSVTDEDIENQSGVTIAENPITNTAVTPVKELDVNFRNQAIVISQSLVETSKNVQMQVAKAPSKAKAQDVKKDTVKPVLLEVSDKPLQKLAQEAKDNVIQTKKFGSSESRPVNEIVHQATTLKVTSQKMMKVATEQPASKNRMPVTDTSVAVNPIVNKEKPFNVSLTAEAVDLDAKTTVMSAQSNNISARPAEINNEELGHLIENLIASYNKGDLEAFMQLLEEDVVTDEPGGKVALRQAYAKLFNKTSQREMQLKDLNWQRHGEMVSTTSKYEVSVTSAATAETAVHHGVLQFEVIRREGRPVIHAFYHLPDGNGP